MATFNPASFTNYASGGIFSSASISTVRIRYLTPATGSSDGGTVVVIVGEGFSAAGNSVTIGGAVATISSQSTTSITVTTPPGAVGTADVKVTDASLNTDTYADAFTYTTVASIVEGAPLDRSTGLGITGEYTTVTGPDLIDNTAYSITTAFQVGNLAQTSGTLMFLSTTESNPNSMTMATWDSFTDSNSTTWYLRYFRGAIPLNVTLPSGIVVFDIRIYSDLIADTLIEHYFKDMEENRGRRYLP